ncbi:hypothetical protein F5Y13DRAFT_147541 [Hypoxylon sp. FL1857]|nr:hypothetical protein F5Y13DRAFT_147541 [Hypoxylon sp. FL1857]
MATFSSWYTAVPGAERLVIVINKRVLIIIYFHISTVRNIFAEALVAFSTELSRDDTKLKWIVDTNHGNLESFLQTVLDARVHYEARKGDSRVREVLVELSEKIHHYGGIMDVLVSHHPEYAALAWGAMKFLFVGVTNHQKLIYKLSAGLSQVASILPRACVIIQLYPTPQVNRIIVSIYAHILKFLLRALKWYQESKVKHMVHAITQPAELRFNDILETITELSRSMTEMAWVSSHAEQRDMHTSIIEQSRGQKQIQLSVDRLASDVKAIQASMAAEHAINATARVQIHHQLSEIQLVQFLDHLASTPLPDPVEAFQASLFFSNRYRQKPSNWGPAFWLDDKIQGWNRSRDSSLVMVKGTWQLRSHIQNFCVQSIAALQQAKVPVIWALKTMVPNKTTAVDDVSTISLLKYLISQAVTLNERIHTDTALTPRLGAYRAAKTEQEWVNILASVVEGIPLLYVIIDVEVLCQSREGLSRFWPSGLLKMFSDISARNIKTVVRVALVSYGASLLNKSKNHQDLLVTVNDARRTQVAVRAPYHGASNSNQSPFDLRRLGGGKQPRSRLGRSTRWKRRS